MACEESRIKFLRLIPKVKNVFQHERKKKIRKFQILINLILKKTHHLYFNSDITSEKYWLSIGLRFQVLTIIFLWRIYIKKRKNKIDFVENRRHDNFLGFPIIIIVCEFPGFVHSEYQIQNTTTFDVNNDLNKMPQMWWQTHKKIHCKIIKLFASPII